MSGFRFLIKAYIFWEFLKFLLTVEYIFNYNSDITVEYMFN